MVGFITDCVISYKYIRINYHCKNLQHPHQTDFLYCYLQVRWLKTHISKYDKNPCTFDFALNIFNVYLIDYWVSKKTCQGKEKSNNKKFLIKYMGKISWVFSLFLKASKKDILILSGLPLIVFSISPDVREVWRATTTLEVSFLRSKDTTIVSGLRKDTAPSSGKNHPQHLQTLLE